MAQTAHKDRPDREEIFFKQQILKIIVLNLLKKFFGL